MTDLSGKVAVVTGGGGGLGAALGKVFAEAGAAVAALDIDEAAAGAGRRRPDRVLRGADDLTTMLEHRPMGAEDVVMPDHAVRHLLADLEANEPYCLTHGSHRPVYEERRAAMDAAFDRMEEP